MKTVQITPNYENTAAFFATGLREHLFTRGSREPIISLVEQIRYLTQTDPGAVERLLMRLGGGGRA